MKLNYYFLLSLLWVLAGKIAYAQHSHDTIVHSAQLQFAPVLNTFLTDPELKEFQLQSTLMTVPPTLIDTVSHRHDADLFGYVVEGTVQIGLDFKEPNTFTAGQMFHEKETSFIPC